MTSLPSASRCCATRDLWQVIVFLNGSDLVKSGLVAGLIGSAACQGCVAGIPGGRACVRVTMTTTETIGINGMAYVMLTVSHYDHRLPAGEDAAADVFAELLLE